MGYQLGLFRSNNRSPVSSCDRVVFVINLQEADLIKKIDFKQELIDSLE
jgi:hypothetical protein